MELLSGQSKLVFTGTHSRPDIVRLPLGSVAVFSRAAPGKYTVNEDACAVIAVDDTSAVLAVADGVGGHPQGDEAARLAIKTLAQQIRRRGELPLRAAIVNGFESAHAAIMRRLPGAATTLAAVEINGRTARTYNVGDSAVCVIGGRGKVKLQTVAHSPIGYAVESGLLTEAEAMWHGDRHLVSNLLGVETMFIEIGSPFVLAPRDTVIVASDGLYDNLVAEEIAGPARQRPLAAACAGVVELASGRMSRSDSRHPGKPDDLTMLLYRGS